MRTGLNLSDYTEPLTSTASKDPWSPLTCII